MSLINTLLTLLLVFSLSCSGSGGGDSAAPAAAAGTTPENSTTCDLGPVIPLSFTYGSEYLEVDSGGGVVYATGTPFGFHTPPLGGHSAGKFTINMWGFYSPDYSGLTYLSGGDGAPCSAGDTCGITDADLIARMPTYVSPANNFQVSLVRLEDNTSEADYYDGDGKNQKWLVRGTFCNSTHTYSFGHIRSIAADLRAALIAAGYADPAACNAACEGQNLITGAAITLNAGDSIAQAQIIADQVPGHAGYWKGYTYLPETPYAQIEFDIMYWSNGIMQAWPNLLSASAQTSLYNIIKHEASNTNSFYYHDHFGADAAWLWRAQMGFINFQIIEDNDYTSILKGLGAWGEWDPDNAGDCELADTTPWGTKCDDALVIFAINKATDFYNTALYASADVSYLIHKYNVNANTNVKQRWGEVLSPASLNTVQDSVLIKWRTIGMDNTTDIDYQGFKFFLDTENSLLRVRWTTEHAAQADALTALNNLAAPNAASTCDGTDNNGDVKCYNRSARARMGTWSGL